MTDEQGYNGWTNYETWVTALWIDNDVATYSHSRDTAAEAIQAAEDDGRTAEGILADWIRDWIMEECRPAADASLFEDILSAGLERVDWYQIAANYLTEVAAS